MPRLALSEPSIGSTTTSGQPCAADAADLLRDDRARSSRTRARIRVLGGPVDRRRVVAAEAFADDRLALDARRQPLEHGVDVRDSGPTELQPVSHSGSNSRPDVSFG